MKTNLNFLELLFNAVPACTVAAFNYSVLTVIGVAVLSTFLNCFYLWFKFWRLEKFQQQNNTVVTSVKMPGLEADFQMKPVKKEKKKTKLRRLP